MCSNHIHAMHSSIHSFVKFCIRTWSTISAPDSMREVMSTSDYYEANQSNADEGWCKALNCSKLHALIWGIALMLFTECIANKRNKQNVLKNCNNLTWAVIPLALTGTTPHTCILQTIWSIQTLLVLHQLKEGRLCMHKHTYAQGGFAVLFHQYHIGNTWHPSSDCAVSITKVEGPFSDQSWSAA